MNAAFEAVVRSRPSVCVPKPANASSPRASAGRTAPRWNGTHAKQAAATENRSANSSGTGRTASVSLMTTNVVPQITVTRTRTATPSGNGMPVIMPLV